MAKWKSQDRYSGALRKLWDNNARQLHALKKADAEKGITNQYEWKKDWVPGQPPGSELQVDKYGNRLGQNTTGRWRQGWDIVGDTTSAAAGASNKKPGTQPKLTLPLGQTFAPTAGGSTPSGVTDVKAAESAVSGFRKAATGGSSINPLYMDAPVPIQNNDTVYLASIASPEGNTIIANVGGEAFAVSPEEAARIEEMDSTKTKPETKQPPAFLPIDKFRSLGNYIPPSATKERGTGFANVKAGVGATWGDALGFGDDKKWGNQLDQEKKNAWGGQYVSLEDVQSQMTPQEKAMIAQNKASNPYTGQQTEQGLLAKLWAAMKGSGQISPNTQVGRWLMESRPDLVKKTYPVSNLKPYGTTAYGDIDPRIIHKLFGEAYPGETDPYLDEVDGTAAGEQTFYEGWGSPYKRRSTKGGRYSWDPRGGSGYQDWYNSLMNWSI